MRRNVRFHSNEHFTPSRTLNADDVLFSFERQWKSDHPYHTVGPATYDYFRGMGLPTLLKSVEKLDDHTVRITLNRPEAPFLADLAMPFLSIQSAEYADSLMKAKRPDLFDEAPIGTGPFRLVSYQRDLAIPLQGVRRLLAGAPASGQPDLLDHPEHRRAPEQAAVRRVSRDDLPNPAELGKIEKDPNLVIEQQDGKNVAYMALNTGKPPLDDVRVRRAVTPGDRQAHVGRCRLPEWRAAGKEPDPARHVVLRRQHR
ncbi:ABC transporter substrate-binding protein, partial [Azospirillum sp. INR13]|uniref:ABC transporter substrate-binding protein n=1 Tax=Azospirillum sp. INR13 TaxID=2596919 RepID=UPI00210549AB